MSALRIKFGMTHHVTHIDDHRGKMIVSLECGGAQEINDDNRNRFTIIVADGDIGCPFCRESLDEKEDENRDDHSDTANP